MGRCDSTSVANALDPPFKERLAPAGVEVVTADSFRHALEILRDDPPAAAIFSIAPPDLPWQEVGELCRSHTPPIPFLCCSAVEDDPQAIERIRCATDHFFCKPIPASELRSRIERLIAEVRQN